jgi:cytoskeleton protein RodZ
LTEQVLTGVGAELKRAREAADLAIDAVARELKLLPRQIESLEQERFDRLPGPSIARGMVRNYARFLKLDPEPLVERMTPRTESAPDAGVCARDRQTPAQTGGWRLALLYGAFACLLVIVGAVAYKWQEEPAPLEAAAPVEPQPSQPAVQEEPVKEPPAEPIEKPPTTEKPQVPEPAPAVALPPGVHRLVLRMEQEAWLEVRDGSGRSLVSSLNPAGSERAVRGQPPFQLVIGNASHVTLTYDGKPVDLAPHIRSQVARLTLE